MPHLKYRDERGQETAVDLRDSIVRIGRQPDCELLIQKPFVGRRHAQIEPRADDWWIVDLDSVQGTLVNGMRVEESLLRAGDQILIAGVELVTVEAGSAPRRQVRSLESDGTAEPTSGLLLSNVEVLRERPVAGSADAGIAGRVAEAVRALDMESACAALLDLAMSLVAAERGIVALREGRNFRPVAHRVGDARTSFDPPIFPTLSERMVKDAVAVRARDTGILASRGVKGAFRTLVAAPLISASGGNRAPLSSPAAAGNARIDASLGGYLLLDGAGDALTDSHLDVICTIVSQAGSGISRLPRR